MSLLPPLRQIVSRISPNGFATTALLLERCGYGLAAFELRNTFFQCVYLSPLAKTLLGNEAFAGSFEASSPPHLRDLMTVLQAQPRTSRERLQKRIGNRHLEVEPLYLRDSPGSSDGKGLEEDSMQVLVVLRDIDTSDTQLQEERDRFERALNATGQAVWDWNLETGSSFVSDRWAEMLGRIPGSLEAEALYSPENWHDAIHPDDEDAVANAYAQFIVGELIDYDIEFRMRHADGAYRWIRSRATALRRSDKTAWRVTGVHSDVTVRKELETAQEDLLRQQSRIAETLQRVLLPLPNGARFAGLDLEFIYEPASDEALVGGDFCDAFPVGDREIALVVGDVTGKGLNAAVVTAEIKFSLRTLLRQYRDPAVAVRLLNRLLWESYQGEHGKPPPMMPLAVIVANTRTHYLRCCIAGAEPPMILRQDENGALYIEEITEGGFLIGAMPEEAYERQIVHLGPNDHLLMTTDGLTEVRDPLTGHFLGTKGVARLAHKALQLGRPLDDTIDLVVRSVRNYGGGPDAIRDDVSLIIARWRSTI